MAHSLEDEITAYLNEMEQVTKEEVVAACKWGAEIVRDEARDRVPVDMGNLQGAIQIWEVLNDRSEIIGYKVGVPDDVCNYAAYVEFGTRPHWMPIAPLIAWAARHGMDEGAAYAIQAKIAERGTYPQPFLYMSMDFDQPVIEVRIEDAIDIAISRVTR